MSDRPALELNPNATPGINQPVDLGRLARELQGRRELSPPGSTGLPRLDLLPAPLSSGVLQNLTPRAADRPAATAPVEQRPGSADATGGRPAEATPAVRDNTGSRSTDDAGSRATDASARPGDAPVKRPVNGVLELDYGDPAFDRSLARRDYHTLRIKGFPANVELKPWMDDGGYFFWFLNGSDNRAHHYFPANLKTIEIEQWNGRQYKPYIKPVDELRISAAQGTAFEAHRDAIIQKHTARLNATDARAVRDIIVAVCDGNTQAWRHRDRLSTSASTALTDAVNEIGLRIGPDGKLMQQPNVGFASFDSRTHPYRYALRMSELSEASLDLLDKALRDGAASAPTNPYFRIYLGDITLARAIRPVIEALKAGREIKLDNPETIRKIDEAIEEYRKAQEISRRNGDVRLPNVYLQQALSPFGLNRYYYNPDAYWGGAAYQSYQREVALTAVKAMIKSGILNAELPPALPPR